MFQESVNVQTQKIDKQIIEIMKLMDENAKYLVEMTNAMTDISKNANVILVKCDRIKQAEHTIDDIYTDYISHLLNRRPTTSN